jgi:hypothetical protein
MLGVDRLRRIPEQFRGLAEVKANLRDLFFPHREGAKVRVQEVINNRTELEPPVIKDWLQITDEELANLKMYLRKVANHVKDLGPAEELKYLNAQASFEDHLMIMHEYVDVLYSIPRFRSFLEKHGISKNFLHALVETHDAGRWVFNGKLSLLYVDGVSDGLIKAKYSNYPKNYSHSIWWIIDSLQAPDMVNGQEINAEMIPVASKIGLILKTIDTNGKFDDDGQLIHPDSNFGPGNRHERWIKNQVASNRLPFYVKGDQIVTAEQYAANDQRLTEKGAQVIESKTGLPFAEIRNLVAERLTK